MLAAGRAEAPQSPPACVHELFAAQAARTPALAAVAGRGGALGYAELERAANRLAHHLRTRGVGPETRVAICLEPGVELVVGVLAILKAGGAYVPLEPSYPAGRLAHVLGDSGAALLVSRSRLLETLPAFRGPVVDLDRDRGEIAGAPDRPVRSGVAARNAAYVIYTSGSTGTPKGVVVEHAGLAGTLRGARDCIALGAGEVMPSLASPAFDIWSFEVFAPLLAGGQVRVPEPDAARDVERLVEELAGADAFHAVPALMREVVERVRAPGGPGALPRMRTVLVGGDAVPPSLLEQVREAFPSARTWVLYGPTEASILAASSRPRGAAVPGWQAVGRPLPGVGLYVCGPGGALLPDGVPGELWIGGAGVARGYLGRPELTAEKFVPDAWGGGPGARLYRSGDRVRRRADGELEFLGRLDAQVKIRGFRIEPGEVEAALLAQEGVHDAVVMVREDAPGRKRLVAYVVAREGAAPPDAALRARLGERLPEHMVPGAFVFLERLPLNANGKVDRRALPAPERGTGPPPRRRAPRRRRCWAGSGPRCWAWSGWAWRKASSSWGATRSWRRRWSPGPGGRSGWSCRCGRSSRLPPWPRWPGGSRRCGAPAGAWSRRSSRWGGTARSRPPSPSSGSGWRTGWSRGAPPTTCPSGCGCAARWTWSRCGGAWTRWRRGTRRCAPRSRSAAASSPHS